MTAYSFSRTVLCSVFCLVACLFGNAKASDPTIDFAGRTYNLAFVGGTPGFPVNEYLVEGETVEDWSSMVSVRHFPNFDSAEQYVKLYVEKLQPHLVCEAVVHAPEDASSNNDLTVEAYLAPANRAYIEYNLFRFVVEPGVKGLKAYQFAIRGEYNLEAAQSANEEALKGRLEELQQIKVDAIDIQKTNGAVSDDPITDDDEDTEEDSEDSEDEDEDDVLDA